METPQLQKLAEATEQELQSLMPHVRERILDRLRLAYWVGVGDAYRSMVELDNEAD